jgi:hypothetical protein
MQRSDQALPTKNEASKAIGLRMNPEKAFQGHLFSSDFLQDSICRLADW